MKKINVCDAGAHIRSRWIPAFARITMIAITRTIYTSVKPLRDLTIFFIRLPPDVVYLRLRNSYNTISS